MHFTHLIKMPVPKCKFTVQIERKVRSIFISLRGYLIFVAALEPSCSVGRAGLSEPGGAAGHLLREVLWGWGRTGGLDFLLAAVSKSGKSHRVPPCAGRDSAGRGQRDRRDACKGEGTSIALVMRAVPPERAGHGYMTTCMAVGGQRSVLLLVRQRVLFVLGG